MENITVHYLNVSVALICFLFSEIYSLAERNHNMTHEEREDLYHWYTEAKDGKASMTYSDTSFFQQFLLFIFIHSFHISFVSFFLLIILHSLHIS